MYQLQTYTRVKGAPSVRNVSHTALPNTQNDNGKLSTICWQRNYPPPTPRCN